MSKPKIYPSVVTWGADWRQQLRDVKKLKLREATVFLTGIDKDAHQEFYRFLKNSGIKKIPHIHLRHDFDEDEIKDLTKEYGVDYFTIHFKTVEHYLNWNKSLKDKMCVEYNADEWEGVKINDFEFIKEIAGVCVDIGHYAAENLLNRFNTIELFKKVIDTYPVVINHLNGKYFVKNKDGCDEIKRGHLVVDIKKDFEYLDDVPRKLFTKNVYLELRNTIPEQIEIRDYLYGKYFK
ncbi:hypothetical protein KKD19_04390 [Patescibacteria group bacterium]|nr:hypothetical protein [Patescibacteria group bacterium]MBU4512447.1 hypothetical protein [Patescibacteria group bacterium]MCG2692575.1 hypothetical protein [Candidatus Parcubacteria bacterium]